MKTLSCCGLKEKEMLYRWHTYKNGCNHIRVNCPKCGKYIGYAPQCTPYTEWVTGTYKAPAKPQEGSVCTLKPPSQTEIVLASIISLPCIKNVIGELLYNQAIEALNIKE